MCIYMIITVAKNKTKSMNLVKFYESSWYTIVATKIHAKGIVWGDLGQPSR